MHRTLSKLRQHFEGIVKAVCMYYLQLGVKSKNSFTDRAEWISFCYIVKQHKQFTKKLRMLLLGQFFLFRFESLKEEHFHILMLHHYNCYSKILYKNSLLASYGEDGRITNCLSE